MVHYWKIISSFILLLSNIRRLFIGIDSTGFKITHASQHYNNLTQSAIEKLLAMSIVHSASMTSRTIIAFDNTVKLGITLPKSILHKIDQKRADIPRSRFIRRAIESYLSASSYNKAAAKRRSWQGK